MGRGRHALLNKLRKFAAPLPHLQTEQKTLRDAYRLFFFCSTGATVEGNGAPFPHGAKTGIPPFTLLPVFVLMRC